MTAADAEVTEDQLWIAVGEPTRRRLLDLVLAGEAQTVTALSDRLPITRQAVAKHLIGLKRAGLGRATAAGRERLYRVDEDQLGRAVKQLTSVGAEWDRRLRRIKRIAEAIQRGRVS